MSRVIIVFSLFCSGFTWILFILFFFSSRMSYGPWLSSSTSKVPSPALSPKVISPFLPFIAFAFCIYLVILRPISLICMFYLPTHKLCRVKGHVTLFFIPYKQWLSNFIMHQNHLKSDFKKQITEPHHQSFWFSKFGVGLKMYFSDKFRVAPIWLVQGPQLTHVLPK